MTNTEIKDLLLEDLEYKKSFEAFPSLQCDGCGEYVANISGGEFVFMGDKKKLCSDCLFEITEYLEGV